MKLFAFGLLLSMALISDTAVSFASEKRTVSAHEHGHGEVSIVADGNTLVVEFEVPGADIVGFEGEAKNDGQRAKIRNASDVFSDAGKIIQFPAKAGCTLREVEVEVEGHDDHSEFHVEYEFSCTNIQAIDEISFPFFRHFPGSEEMELKAVLPNGPVSAEIDRDDPKVSF